ncbi:hypothetical protein T439DRAFT_382588 [Meredithblackwellia eburnea MCA 4105]
MMAPRRLRPNNILGLIIPPLLVLLGVKGYSLVVIETAAYIALRYPVVARLYQAQFIIFLALLTYSFALVYLPSRHHSRPPVSPPEEVVRKRVVFACDADGEPRRCFKGDCKGSWVSARTRHCADCGVCKETFDHHCPFMNSCITSVKTYKPFLAFLFYSVILIGISIIPVTPLQYAAVKEVVRKTWETEWMYENWWRRWYAWAGGPVYRYAIAVFLGYWRYYKLDPPPPPILPSPSGSLEAPSPYPSLANPKLWVLLTVLGGSFVFWVGIAMIITILLNFKKGLTSIQVSRSRHYRSFMRGRPPSPSTTPEPNPVPTPTPTPATRLLRETVSGWDPRLYLFVPITSAQQIPNNTDSMQRKGVVLKVDPAIRLWDVGFGANWRQVMGESVWRWFCPWIPT